VAYFDYLTLMFNRTVLHVWIL